LRKEFIEALGNTAATHLHVQNIASEDSMILEIAITELSPTEVAVNSVANVGSLLVPGTKIVKNAVAVGGPAAGGALAAGSIAIEMKLSSVKGGQVLAEAKDRQKDPASILPNYRDFERYGWSRKTISDWAKQLAEVFSTPASKKIEGSSKISIFPW